VNRTQARGLGWPGGRAGLTWPGGRAGVAIRQARTDDMPALGEFFAGLSTYTRYLRFFGPVTPRAALLRTLCGDPDNVDALVAVRGAIVGHAIAVDRAEAQGTLVTDIGIVVDDAWQGRGVGAALMRALVTGAQARGVTSLEMDVLGINHRVVAMITGHWPAARVDRTPDGLAIRIQLPQAASKPPAMPTQLATGQLATGQLATG
jgi:GNAT superfamily N-acetyltransferase